MLDELDILLDSIKKQYINLYSEWEQSNLYVPINQKKESSKRNKKW